MYKPFMKHGTSDCFENSYIDSLTSVWIDEVSRC